MSAEQQEQLTSEDMKFLSQLGGEAWPADTAEEAAIELRERNEDEVFDPQEAVRSEVLDVDDFESQFGTCLHCAEGTESGCAEWYETYGSDLEKVKAILANPDPRINQTVWTAVDGDDGRMYLTAGYHFVNRIYYVISKKPWVTGQEEFLW